MSSKKIFGEVKDYNFSSFTETMPSASTFHFNKIIDEKSESKATVVNEHNLAKSVQFSIVQEVKDHRGHAQYETELFEKKLEEELAKSLKNVKKAAYDDAYRHGLQVAKNEIENQFLSQFDDQLKELKHFAAFIKKHQSEILEQNKKEILKIVHLVCSWILHKECNTDYVERILPVILSKVQETSKIIIKVDPKTYQDLQNANNFLQNKYSDFKDLRVISDDHITHPGVIVESESNIFDASQETLKAKINDIFNVITESSNGSGTSEN